MALQSNKEDLEKSMNIPKIEKRIQIVESTLNRKLSNHCALQFIPHATSRLKAIQRDWQVTNFCVVYVFATGDKPFYIVHKFARIIRIEMLDQNHLIPEIEGHLNRTIPAYYGDEYFFFEKSPFEK